MLFVFIFSFFSTHTVAFPQNAEAMFSNPAGIGWQSAFETLFLSSNDFSFSFLGIGGARIGKVWRIGSGVSLGNFFKIGSYYEFDKKIKGIYGVNLIPLKNLSLGAVVYNFKDFSGRIGIGIRPIKEITIFSDMLRSPDSIRYLFGAMFRPAKGIFLYGAKKEQPVLGTEIHAGILRFYTEYAFQTRNFLFGAGLSYPLYESFLPSRKKFAEIRIEEGWKEEREPAFLSLFFIPPLKNSFFDFMSMLEEVEKRDDIKGVVIRFEGVPPVYQAEEIRKKIEKIREKKEVYTYSYEYSLITYYIATAGDKIFIHPKGMFFLNGVYAEKIFFKNLFEKFGVDADLLSIGKYKSAIEPFTREKISKEDSIQTYAFLEDIYQELKEKIEKRVGEKEIEHLFKKVVFFSKEAKENHLVDSILTESQLASFLKKKKVLYLPLRRVLKKRERNYEWRKESKKIAVLILDGPIVEGRGGRSPIFGIKSIGSFTMRKILSHLERDKSIKGVVIRVNSPGGSAKASQEIWSRIKRLSKKKPVVVSMAGVAASGGYYISAGASKIVADKTTLTGSIGIFGGKFVFKKLYNKIGIKKDIIKLSPHADMFSDYRKFTDEERKILKEMLEKVYWSFVKDVAFSKEMEPSRVDSLGRGRIWSGKRAKEIGLVDENGGILDAIEHVKKLAKLKDANLVILIPRASLRGFDIFNEPYLYLFPWEIKIKDFLP